MSSKPHELVFHGLREAVSFSLRGIEKLKDKYIWSKSEVEEARGYLIYFRDTIRHENESLFHALFGESGDFFELQPFARGYNSKVLSFKTIIDSKVKKWVIKVGFRISPVIDFGDPSTEGYFEEYQSYLDLLRKAVAERPILSHLLPEPQAISFATLSSDEHGKIGTTLAIQPFMHVVRPGDLKKTITKGEKLQLLSELRSFKELSAHLMDTYQIRPELIGEGNLEIVRFGEEYHLMLLDMGWVDLKKPLPITQTIAHFSAQYVIGKLENWLKSKVGE